MNYSFIDIHSHLNFPDYDQDIDTVIADMKSQGVATIVVGTTQATSQKAIELAEKHENIWAIVGIHPVHVHEEVIDVSALEAMARHPRVVGIGECGFDFFHKENASFDMQKKAFLAQIEIAEKVKKPLMLHLRNSPDGVENAYDKALDILKERKGLKGNAHFYAGTLAQAHQFFVIGFTISFTGVITFAQQYRELVAGVPLENIMSETDCPFVAPTPHRGHRNRPDYVVEVVKKIAEIRGENLDVVKKTLLENAEKAFSIRLLSKS